MGNAQVSSRLSWPTSLFGLDACAKPCNRFRTAWRAQDATQGLALSRRSFASLFTRVLLTWEFSLGKINGMDQGMPLTYTAFLDGHRLATGSLHEVAVAVLRARQTQPEGNLLVFSNASGQCVDLDLRGGEDAVAARYTEAVPTQASRGRGRPKLGVVAREVTLLPEHWDWLAAQPGGASVALRKLVHEARRRGGDRERTRQARDRAYHAMSTLAGDFAGFEEASRALFAGDHERLAAQMAAWPDDVRGYVLQLAEPASG